MTREEALKTLEDLMVEGFIVGDTIFPLQDEEAEALGVAIDALQEPERKHGEWMGTVCSCCGGSTVDYYDCDFCPKCGAIMGGKE